eukprot:CAMPEP_0169254408 /NCGR_PEP_ID=MMETSP1016-20121227/39158_1 /TAXON_ID=342587 /ORGANISM="Karlodinium micrum, Strain CCMP2283" /LENGTH=159 /DNA_ID=CAMNT_0009335865 /DNA_START=88 /DNA_END=565 /DNA_ORIENTATION=+
MVLTTKLAHPVLLTACCITLLEAGREEDVVMSEIKEHARNVKKSAETSDLESMAADVESRSAFMKHDVDPHASASKLLSALDDLQTHTKGSDDFYRNTKKAVRHWATEIPAVVERQSKELSDTVQGALTRLKEEHGKVQAAVSNVVGQASETHADAFDY